MKAKLMCLICIMAVLLTACAQQDTGVKSVEEFCKAVYTLDSDMLSEMRESSIPTDNPNLYLGISEKYDSQIKEVGNSYCVKADYASMYVGKWLGNWVNDPDVVSTEIESLSVKRIEDISDSEQTYSVELTLKSTKSDKSTDSVSKNGRAGTDKKGKLIYIQNLES